MTKILYLVLVAAVLLYCRFLGPLAGNDVPLYGFSTLMAALLLLKHRFFSKDFWAHFLGMQSLTVWGCYFFLPVDYQLVTQYLNYVKGLLLGFFLVLEAAALVHMSRRYLVARRKAGMFAGESFAYAIDPYPLIPEMQKLFIVEFNIWRALVVRLGLLVDRDGGSLKTIASIDPGYRAVHVRLTLAVFLGVNLLCLWLLEGWWLAIPFVSTFYLTLLLNSDTLQFKRHAIYDTGRHLKIPNGIYGFVTVDKANIDTLVAGPAKDPDLQVARLAPSNILMRLAEPILVFGEPVRTIGLCVNDADRFEKECHAAGAAVPAA